jgi:hypothetical protein
VFENRVLRGMFGPKKEGEKDQQEAGENSIVRGFIIRVLRRILLG